MNILWENPNRIPNNGVWLNTISIPRKIENDIFYNVQKQNNLQISDTGHVSDICIELSF